MFDSLSDLFLVTRLKGTTEYMEFHAIAEVFPLMSDAEFERLEGDIAANGLLEAIWIYQGKIIDGRNRFKACERAGVEPRFRQYEGAPESLVAFVVSLNLHRRHLSESQRAMIAARIANLKDGQRRAQICAPVTQPEAAEMLNVSRRSVQSAAKVLSEGVADLAEKVEAGEITVSQAAQIAALPKGKQKRLIRKGRKSAQKILTQMRTESLKKVTKEVESESLIFINRNVCPTKENVSAAMQQLASAFPAFATYFLDVVEELESLDLSDQTREAYDNVLAAIRMGLTEFAQIQAKTKYPKDFLEHAIATMLDYNMIYAISQGGKTDVARGARKTLYFEFIPDDEDEKKPENRSADESSSYYNFGFTRAADRLSFV